MSDTKWTKGPWRAHESMAGCVAVVTAADGQTVCEMYAVGDLNSGKADLMQSDANAHLIAAAPDLYAACEAFVEAWEKCLQLEKTDVALRMAIDALDKAQK